MIRNLVSLFCFLVFLAFEVAGITEPKDYDPPLQTGENYALFFAVDQYDSLRPLQNPVKDAYRIAAELSNHYGFKTDVVENSTFKEIEQKLEEYKKEFAAGRFAEDGQLLIFFSGHGMIENKNGYFLAKDSDPKELQRTALPYEYWRPFINSIDCKHIMVALDACFSGTFDPGWWDKAGRFGRPGELSESEKLKQNHRKYKTRMFFSSATEVASPDDSNFAKKFLAGLRSWGGKDAILSSTELYSHLELASPKPHFGDFGNYEPGSSFLFIVENPLDTEVLALSDTDALQKDLNTWRVAKSADSVIAYQAYLKEYPTGEFRAAAIIRIRELQEDMARRREELEWEIAREKNTEEGYLEYQRKYPDGLYYADASARIKALDQPKSRSVSEVVIPKGMVLVNGGTFEMGDLFGDGGEDEEPVHQVTVSSFYLSIYELTYAEFDAFLDSTDRGKLPKLLLRKSSRPINNVNWYEAIEYCNWRSRNEGLEEVYQINNKRRDLNNKNTSSGDAKWIVHANWSADGYRLPTEAEWEYAARSEGIIEKYAGTSDIALLMNYANNGKLRYPEELKAIGSLKPNKQGLYDMIGNVGEWCWDWYGTFGPLKRSAHLEEEDSALPQSIDPRGPDSGGVRVTKGGSYETRIEYLNISNRDAEQPDSRSRTVGFRLARSIK